MGRQKKAAEEFDAAPKKGRQKRKAPDDDNDDESEAPPEKELSEAKKAQLRRRHAKKSTVVMGLHALLDHAAVAARWPVDSGAFVEHLDEIVVAASQAAVLACELLALHLARDTTNVVRKVDQSLCAAALRLVSETGISLDGKAKEAPELRATYVDHFRPAFPADFPWPELHYAGNIVAALARDMKANFEVYHDEAVTAHVVRFLADQHTGNKAGARRLWSAAQARAEAGTPTNGLPFADRDATALARVLLDSGPAELHRRLLRRIEAHNAAVPDAARHWRYFTLAPLRAIARQFVAVDAQLLKAWKLPVALADFFPPRRGWEPCAEWKTDAVRASLTYARLGGASAEEEDEAHPVRAIGGKPGKRRKAKRGNSAAVDVAAVDRCLVTLGEVEPDLEALDVPWEAFDPGKHDLLVGNKGTRLSRKEWELRRGTLRARDELERRKRVHGIHAHEAVLAEQHLNTADPRRFAQCLAARWTVARWTALWAFWSGRWRARQRFALKMREQRSYAHLANLVLGWERNKVCVLGNAVFIASQRGLPPTPTLTLRRYLARSGRVVLVDEYRTSKTCSVCGDEMHKHPGAWSIYHCKSCKITWSRDRNAALNIAHVYERHHAGQPRPAHLCRQPTTSIATP